MLCCCCWDTRIQSFEVPNRSPTVIQMESSPLIEGTADGATQDAIEARKVGESEVAVGDGIESPNNEGGLQRDQRGISRFYRVVLCRAGR